MLFNDFDYGSITATAQTIRVILHSRHSQGFSSYDSIWDDESYIAVRLFFGTPDQFGLNDDLYIRFDEEETRVYSTTGSTFNSVYKGPSAISGQFIDFVLDRSYLGGANKIYWSATGAEARSTPDCSGSSCSWYDYDRMPEILQPLPSLTLP